MNIPYIVIIEAVLWAISVGCALDFGVKYGRNEAIAAQTKTDAVVARVAAAAQASAAAEIAKIKPQNVTIQQDTQHEVQTHVIYRDCRITADGLRLANGALSGAPAQPVGGGQLPGPDAAGR